MLPQNLLYETVNVILQTGFAGSAEEYVQTYYGKDLKDLTVCEAEMIVRCLKDKDGCLSTTIEGGSHDSSKHATGSTAGDWFND